MKTKTLFIFPALFFLLFTQAFSLNTPDTNIGITNDLYSEFSYNSPNFNPTHIVGSNNLSTMRDWIGISNGCTGCYPGYSKFQTLEFNNLEIGKRIKIKINAIRTNGSSDFIASIVGGSGTIVSGSTKSITITPDRKSTWEITVQPNSSNLSIKLGNYLTSGTAYIYIDSIVVSPVIQNYIETEITKQEMCSVSFAGATYANNTFSQNFQDTLLKKAVTPIIYKWDLVNFKVSAENSEFGYSPSFTPGRVSFSSAGRPIIRDKEFNMQILSSTGSWKSINLLEIAKKSLSNQGISWSTGTFGPIPHQAYADGDVTYESRIVYDNACNAYTVLWSSPSSLNANILMHSPDGGHSWAAYLIPGTGNRFGISMEVPSNSYTLSQPPVLTYYPTDGSAAARKFVVPKLIDGKIVFSNPYTLSDTSVTVSSSGGMENYSVSNGDKIHIVYAGSVLTTDPITGRRGTPAYITTISRSTGQTISPPKLIAVGVSGFDATETDSHNQPSITQDRLGYLHVAIGGHGGPLYYVKSKNPNDSSLWETVERVGMIETPTNLFVEQYTYPTILTDYNLKPFIVARWSGDSYKFKLVLISKSSDGKWSNQKVLLDPGRSFYAHWYHKVSFDPWGRIFINYEYLPGNLYSDEAKAYANTYNAQMIPDTGCLPTNFMPLPNKYCEYYENSTGYIPVNKSVLMGLTKDSDFELATTKTFFKF